MQNKEQKTRTEPRALTPEQLQILKANQEKHLKKMETDPEYRKKLEKREADVKRFLMITDKIETKD